MKGEPRRPKIADSEHEGDDEGEGAVGRVALRRPRPGRTPSGQGREHIEEDGVEAGDAHDCRHQDEAGGHEDPGHGHRDQHLPAEVHELVVAEAGQGAAQPDEEEEEAEHLQRRTRASESGRTGHGREPAAEEEVRAHRGGRDHVHVLRHLQEGEAHRRVLGVEARHQLRLRLRQVEGRAVDLRGGRDQEDERRPGTGGRRSSARSQPAWQSTMSRMRNDPASRIKLTKLRPRASS